MWCPLWGGLTSVGWDVGHCHLLQFPRCVMYLVGVDRENHQLQNHVDAYHCKHGVFLCGKLARFVVRSDDVYVSRRINRTQQRSRAHSQNHIINTAPSAKREEDGERAKRVKCSDIVTLTLYYEGFFVCFLPLRRKVLSFASLAHLSRSVLFAIINTNSSKPVTCSKSSFSGG